MVSMTISNQSSHKIITFQLWGVYGRPGYLSRSVGSFCTYCIVKATYLVYYLKIINHIHFSRRRKSSHQNFTFLVWKSITFWSLGAKLLIGFQNLSRALLKTIRKCTFFMPEINMFLSTVATIFSHFSKITSPMVFCQLYHSSVNIFLYDMHFYISYTIFSKITLFD